MCEQVNVEAAKPGFDLVLSGFNPETVLQPLEVHLWHVLKEMREAEARWRGGQTTVNGEVRKGGRESTGRPEGERATGICPTIWNRGFLCPQVPR